MEITKEEAIWDGPAQPNKAYSIPCTNPGVDQMKDINQTFAQERAKLAPIRDGNKGFSIDPNIDTFTK